MGPELVVVGHVVRDLVDESWRLGGPGAYAALTASALGVRTALLTAAAPDIDGARLLPGVESRILPSPATTTFENRYTPAGRRQRVHAVAARIRPQDVPSNWRQAPAAFVAPVIGEVDTAVAGGFGGYRAIGLQGWLRARDARGNVTGIMPQIHELPAGDVAFCSDEDLAPLDAGEALSALRRRYPLLVLTRGAAGADLLDAAGRRHIEAFPARAVDPTGAGDAFAAGFLVAHLLGLETPAAARWGACAASFVIEAEGLAGVPSRRQLEGRLAAHPGIVLR